MSSDQISEKPLPPEENYCLYCGRVISPTSEICSLCAKVPIQPSTTPQVSNAPAGNKQMTEQLETDMRNAAAWKPMRWGLKMQTACVFAHLLGIVLAGFCLY